MEDPQCLSPPCMSPNNRPQGTLILTVFSTPPNRTFVWWKPPCFWTDTNDSNIVFIIKWNRRLFCSFENLEIFCSKSSSMFNPWPWFFKLQMHPNGWTLTMWTWLDAWMLSPNVTPHWFRQWQKGWDRANHRWIWSNGPKPDCTKIQNQNKTIGCWVICT